MYIFSASGMFPLIRQITDTNRRLPPDPRRCRSNHSKVFWFFNSHVDRSTGTYYDKRRSDHGSPTKATKYKNTED